MSPTQADIEAAIRKAAGDPTTGPIADNAAVMAEAVHQLLEPAAKKEKRIVKAEETAVVGERID